MNDGTKRTLRTAYATVVGFLTALPIMAGAIPVGQLDPSTEATIALFAGWVVIVNRAIAALEDHGVIPAWLRDTNPNKEN